MNDFESVTKMDISEILSEWYGVSDLGVGVIDMDDNITCIDDVVEKFLESIDYFNKKILETDEDYRELSRMQMSDPIAMDYDTEFVKLNVDRIYYQETRDLLQKDLNRLTGITPPWE